MKEEEVEEDKEGLRFRLLDKSPYEFAKANVDVYPLLKEYARQMRGNPTDAEAQLWKYLKGKSLGVTFKRQCVVLDFIADFFCPEQNLIIEVDGGYHSIPMQLQYDEDRTKRLEAKGYNVLRFTNEEVLFDINSVISKLIQYINL